MPLLSHVLCLSSLAASSASGPAPACYNIQNEPAPPQGKFAKAVTLQVGKDIILSGNDMGVAGHVTTHSQCSFVQPSKSFGWNWTRGETTRACAKSPETCPYNPDHNYCYYQFGFGKIQYGINPWGVSSAASKSTRLSLPQKWTQLQRLDVDWNVNYHWKDNKPAKQAPIYRSRLIFDFMLSTQEPQAGINRADTLTDEIVIELAHNDDFALPCGYNPTKPKIESACEVQTADGHCYDIVEHSDFDRPSPSSPAVRMTHFRRQNSTCNGNGNVCSDVPTTLDLKLFIEKAKTYCPDKDMKKPCRSTQGRNRVAGDYVGSIEIGTEIYDNTEGSVLFSHFEVKPFPHTGAEAQLV